MHRMTGSIRAGLFGLVLSLLCGGNLLAQTGTTLASTTTAGYRKANQNKVFYHDGKWWALAFHQAQGAWYIWRQDGASWTRTNKLEKNINYNLDVLLDSTDGPGRLYIHASHHTKPKFRRYTYAAGVWAIDPGFPKKNFQDFVHSDNSNPLAMTMAKNGELWMFRVYNQQLEAKRSSDKGVNWSSPILITSNLTDPKGTIDAVTYSTAAGDFVGVGYAQPNSNGTGQLGFFYHKDGDAETVWTDESASVSAMGSEKSQNNINMAVDGANNVYMFVRTAGGASTDPRNTLYKRSAAAGTWAAFIVNSVGSGVAWQSPALAIDGENGRLYVMGRNMSSNIVEYKVCFIGQESTLASAAIQTLLANGAQAFEEISSPTGLFNATTDILITGDNTTADDIWFNKIDIVSGGAPVTINSAIVTPSTVATPGEYTIDLTLGTSGALTAGAGTITVTWPNDTNVPASIAVAQVTVNGVAASSVVANAAARTATVTVPADLANSANVSLVFSSAANIINPTTVGNYSLQVATSVQPVNALSPQYAVQGSFVIGNITVTPDTAEYPAAYEIPLTLGAAGGLAGGSGTITVTWPVGTFVPAVIAPANVTVNGVAAANVTADQVLRRAVVTVPQALAGSANVYLIFTKAAGVVNPVSGNYTLEVFTSVEVVPGISPSYAIQSQPPVVVGNVTASPNGAASVGSYTIPITLGPHGGLSAGSGTITVTWPNDTNVPNTIAAANVTVDGVAASNVVTNQALRLATVTVPNILANGANVTLVFAAGANITNPSVAGNYSLQVTTSKQSAIANSPDYTIAAQAPVVVGNITVNSNVAGEIGSYTIPITIGPSGSLAGGSGTITVTWPANTSVPGSINTSAVTVNGVNAAAVSANSATRQATVTVPNAIANNANVSLIFTNAASISNPGISGEYSLSVHTSKQTVDAASPGYTIDPSSNPPPSSTGTPIAGTGGDYDKPHQSRVFFHDGKWWLTALNKSENQWKLWKLNGTTWTDQGLVIANDRAYRPDCFVVNASNKLYVFASGTSSSRFLRLSYGGGAWSIDSGYPVTISNFSHSGENSISFSRANNGELWGVRTNSLQVQGIVSTDEGQTWSNVIVIKSGLHNNALTDCHPFTVGGTSYMGVCYSENSTGNSIVGFLRHQDGANSSSWTDETGSLPSYSGTTSDDHINMAVANDGVVYLITKTDGGGATIVDNGLYKRATNGSWQLFPVNRNNAWTRPTISIDQSNNELYAIGTPEGNRLGYYKKVAIGSEGDFENTAQATLFSGDVNAFVNLSTAQHNHTNSSGLMVTVEHDSEKQIYYNLIYFGYVPPPPPVAVNSVVVNPNTTNAVAAYTIGLTLGSTGALTGGSGTITVTWPDNTVVPAAIVNSAVTVNGVAASNLATNTANRFAVITVPNNLAANANVTLAFTAAAGIVNPASVGDYTLQVKTSAQPSQATSPSYNLEAPVPVVVGNIIVNPNTTSFAASYQIPFTLGTKGALTGGNGTITITWPDNTTVPASMATSNVTVNGVNAAAVTTNAATRQAVVTVPGNLAASSNVTLLFNSAAGLVNPTTAGNYTLLVQTSAQPVNATSPSYAIDAPVPVVVGNITVEPDSIGKIASYNIPVTLGANGALAAGSGTITVTWPIDTQIPASIALSNVSVNGNNAAAVVTTPASRRAVVTVPNALTSGSNVTLLFNSAAGIVNPTAAGGYVLNVQTSAQPIDAASPTYDIFSEEPPPPLGTGALVHANTAGARFHKSNQSKVFYHDGAWWLAAYDGSEGDWFLWKYAAGAWTRTIFLESSSGARLDLVPDLANNRFFFLVSHDNDSKVGRAVYSAGAWTVQATTTLSGITHDSNDLPLTMALGKNGHLWVFRIDNGALRVLRSTDAGATWSSDTSLKSSLGSSDGMTDCVVFSSGGVNYVGVFYSVNATAGGVSYGFLKHDDNAALGTWTDESSELTFFGNERADSKLSALAASDGTVYLLTVNANASGSDPSNTLYKRASDGLWSKFKVNTANGTQQWRSPALAIDGSSNRLYVMGVRTSTPNQGQYKFCNIGSEGSLEAKAVTTIFANNTDNFDHLSAPAQPFSAASGMMLAAANLTGGTVWYNHIVSGAAKSSAPEEPVAAAAPIVEGAGVYPNPFNPETTIRFALVDDNDVRLQIFDIRGALVRTLVNRNLPRGIHEARWNGRDKSGNYVASGMYFYRLIVGSKVFKGSMQMIK